MISYQGTALAVPLPNYNSNPAPKGRNRLARSTLLAGCVRLGVTRSFGWIQWHG